MDKKALDSLREVLNKKVMDRFEVGDVIRWKSADTYNYAAVKAGNGLWYITGGGAYYGGRRSFTFDDMVEILSRSEVNEVSVASVWEEIG